MPQNSRSQQLLADAVIKTDYAQNVAVIKCRTGMGSAVGAIIDQMDWDSVVGTMPEMIRFCASSHRRKSEKILDTLNDLL